MKLFILLNFLFIKTLFATDIFWEDKVQSLLWISNGFSTDQLDTWEGSSLQVCVEQFKALTPSIRQMQQAKKILDAHPNEFSDLVNQLGLIWSKEWVKYVSVPDLYPPYINLTTHFYNAFDFSTGEAALTSGRERHGVVCVRKLSRCNSFTTGGL